MLERQIGASGRNGGWCLGHTNGSIDSYGDRAPALAMKRECLRTVDVIGAALEQEGIDAGFVKGGALIVARTEQQRTPGSTTARPRGRPIPSPGSGRG